MNKKSMSDKVTTPQFLKISTTTLILVYLLTAIPLATSAGDWPTYRHDNQRSGITAERLNLPLTEIWRYISPHPPQPAWPEPARADLWHKLLSLQPRVTYDKVFHPVAATNSVYLGSSADDKILCLDAATGNERWRFFTGAPVRLAPSIFDGNVFVGSDDGNVYCLHGATGEILWRYRAGADTRRIPGNGRMISTFPVRTDVIIQDGVAYSCAGLFPNEGVFLSALDARDGSEQWKRKPNNLSPQGYLLASATRLYVPTGRTTPVVFRRTDGKRLRTLNCPRAEGGTFALLTRDLLISGPGTSLREFNADSGDQIASFPGRQMVVTDTVSYLLSDHELLAIDRTILATLTNRRQTIAKQRKKYASQLSLLRKTRKTTADSSQQTLLDKQMDKLVARISKLDQGLRDLKGKEYKWRKTSDTPYAMILAGDVLFTGGDNRVAAFRATDGERLWTAKVTGKAYGLAVANGRLFVSTDHGVLHCFSRSANSTLQRVSPAMDSSPYPQDKWTAIYASAAREIIEKSGVKKGYCLVLGCREGRLAYEITKRTDLQVIGVDENPAHIRSARQYLDKTGIYGVRVTIQQGSLSKLPYLDYFANLIVSDELLVSGNVPTPAEEVFRVLRPYGGVAYLGQTADTLKSSGAFTRSQLKTWLPETSEIPWKISERNGLWAVIRRGAPPGSGEWTHQYAEPGNSACSGDRLVRNPMQLQWFGQPGPRRIVDRHHRPMVSLAKNGRLFVYGDNCVMAVDAYNGTPIWTTNIPHSRRVAAPRDAGQMTVTDRYLYFAVQDSCWALDVATGERALTWKIPQLISDERHIWGYISSVNNFLFGSGEKRDAPYREVSQAEDYEIQWGDFKRMVTSDYLFCLDRTSGRNLWTYQKGVIINPTIAIGDDRVYFVESHNPEALADPDGKITLAVLLGKSANLVALDLRTGNIAWEKPVDLRNLQHIVYLAYAKNTVLVTGSQNKEGSAWYTLYAFDAQNGLPLWTQSHANVVPGTGGDHGEQIHHPVIIGDIVYAEPCAYDLRTGVRVNPQGEKAQWSLSRRGGCGTMSGSSFCLFFRDSNPSMRDLRPDGTRIKLTRVSRPNCWINIIPAGGLILIPEGSSGCTCSYPIQASFALVPKRN